MPTDLDVITRAFGRLTRRAGVTCRHDLRHFTATHLIGAGQGAAVVAGRLAHRVSVALTAGAIMLALAFALVVALMRPFQSLRGTHTSAPSQPAKYLATRSPVA